MNPKIISYGTCRDNVGTGNTIVVLVHENGAVTVELASRATAHVMKKEEGHEWVNKTFNQ